MDVDFFMDPTAWGLTAIFELIILVLMFKVSLWDTIPLKLKIIISIVGIPLYYGISKWQIEKGN